MSGFPVTAPARTDPPGIDPDERHSYETWLDYHRATLLTKCSGLDGEQLARRAVPPSTLSLLGLVRHMTDVERGWFRRVVDGEDVPALHRTDDDPDADLNDGVPERAAQDVAAFEAEVAVAREVAARHGLDDVGRHRHHGMVDLRWVYVHMIEEYARHNGHADLLRECIDGATGD
ncbi:DinB family protein [Kineosporia sp. A_224]|uniref:DinB family protein n=1 Tax=Kineosporia sp. A_224 TaxID=1962180 RepID=UPI000B4B3B45|nr:DinB family protein [Kineosporia sp. A_224]